MPTSDPLHAPALAFLQANRAPLATAAPVITESCFFLDASGKIAFLKWVGSGAVTIAEVPVGDYASLAATVGKYRNLDIDFTDAALAWLAETLGAYRILTVDARDFGTLRLRGRKRFELVAWYD